MLKTKTTVVMISDGKVSANPNEILMTYSLGSCIGICLYDPATHIGAMLHYQLPDSKKDPERAKKMPFMFADTGVEILLKKMLSLGAKKRRMQVKIAGGAEMGTGPSGFDIGKRNHTAIKKVVWKNGLFIDAEDIGGSVPRHMILNIESGAVTVTSDGIEKKL